VGSCEAAHGIEGSECRYGCNLLCNKGCGKFRVVPFAHRPVLKSIWRTVDSFRANNAGGNSIDRSKPCQTRPRLTVVQDYEEDCDRPTRQIICFRSAVKRLE